ncbi:MAG: hypothetical protein IPM47_03475 [Sphingobacteriales bacterium]|nr:MAG: hypothetical protein IPM47_03475 [Sphingobacteriales bacterium]
MKAVKQCVLVLIALLGLMPGLVKGQEELGDYGIPVEAFPTAPNESEATAVINFNFDYMGLNPGPNFLHLDEATKIKLFAFYSPYIRKYALYALDEEKKDVEIKVIPSKDNKNCVFAYIGGDWVNVIISERFTYTTMEEAKKEYKE